jgi:rubrerythrin
MKEWKCTVCGYLHKGKEPPDQCPVCGSGKYRFILNEPLPERVEEMLKAAFAAESKAYVRNLAFSRKADHEQYPGIARLFRAVAEAERVHANEYIKYMEGLVGSTEENLQKAFESEIKANAEGYAPFIKQAIAEGREDVAWSFIRARDVEDRHARLYKAALSAMAVDRPVVYHVCQVCGYVFDESPPDECPVCRTGRDHFNMIG